MSTSLPTVGWLGTGRMGQAMARRLLQAGVEVMVWNRSVEKTQGLLEEGASRAAELSELARREVVFVMVARPSDLEEVLGVDSGLLSATERPRAVVACATVDPETSARVRSLLHRHGVEYLAAPISGNPHVVADAKSTFVVSGPRGAYEEFAPLLERIARTSVWVGEHEEAMTVKICHNLYLGLIAQSVAEVTVLAEKSGVERSRFLDFLNVTGLATPWVRNRTADLLALDWTPTFTTELLRKDFELGMDRARHVEAPMPLAAGLLQLLQVAIGRGYRDADFLSLFALQAESAGLRIEPVGATATPPHEPERE
ncbi:MAG: NAD(P)-dependent oxidoreductase [Acidobacteriota bacterium]|nr:NAD(P)-dependent oxidoreductase [Acidobacteriota bacterium]MDE3146769.1 NAD(P)-dependent oxidoreductase [Acidobacteriota bacterium]